ncbi:ABC transporter ATP-binding protein [Limnochorda pilosa]|uniref:Sodium ABC transporter ATP-binding protein n=1 Tax=Limnochorda pilosa TaxID=1555112 RepID=A0A0K2SGQ0_LIMPI|nr:ATP-binding cassette domain-containing protein [Limnochorda pilosa]BAS26019.1 sodium ABC transporter ATP-binding protein [Limnochorda pilosa]
MLELRGVAKRFGPVRAVEDVDLTVEEGSIFGLIGPNGAGKTTSMRMILNILEPDAGQISWQGRPVRAVAAREFGYLPEERGLYPRMSVRDELRFFAALRGVSGPQLEHEMDGWLDRFMGDQAGKKVEDLSKGNSQKVQFLAAILHRPRLLILDEPFGGLDPVNVQALKEAVRELNAQGTTILFSSHRMDHVEELCTHLALIDRGRVRLNGSLEEVRGSSGRRYLRLTMQDPGDLDALLQRLPQLQGASLAGGGLEAEVDARLDPQVVLQEALAVGPVRRFEVAPPSLEQVYLEQVGKEAVAP